MEHDTALAESVAVLQPPSKVGIIQKALDGLKRGPSIDRGNDSDGEADRWENSSEGSAEEKSDPTTSVAKPVALAATAGAPLHVGKQPQKPGTNRSITLRSSGGCTTKESGEEEEGQEDEDRDLFETDGPGHGRELPTPSSRRGGAERANITGAFSSAVDAAPFDGVSATRPGTLGTIASNRCVLYVCADERTLCALYVIGE